MRFYKSIVIAIIFFYFTLFIIESLSASNIIPNISKEMGNPSFWLKKIKNSNRLLLTSDQIEKITENNLKRQELYLCDLKSLKEEWGHEEILNLFKEDWEVFGKSDEIRYGRDRKVLDDHFWNKLMDNLNREGLKEKNTIRYGLIIKRTDIRVFPTEEISARNPDALEFDKFQHSSIYPGSLIAVYHYSRDNKWAYVQTTFIRGWIKKEDIAIFNKKTDIKDFFNEKDFLIITGDDVKIFLDPFLKKDAFRANMSSIFPIIKTPVNNGNKYEIKIPRKNDGDGLPFKKAYIDSKEDVHQGFLPYTQENIAKQAFKLFNKPYGWGDKEGGRDCSRFIMDIFSCFGIVLPRNSKFQSQIGKSLGKFEMGNLEEKKKILEDALPFATILRIPGHIMLYIGKESGRYYVIHNIWSIQSRDRSGAILNYKIGKVVVTDLSLGESGPEGSLLNRITDIRLIADM